jgi:hypothetical protein
MNKLISCTRTHHSLTPRKGGETNKNYKGFTSDIKTWERAIPPLQQAARICPRAARCGYTSIKIPLLALIFARYIYKKTYTR